MKKTLLTTALTVALGVSLVAPATANEQAIKARQSLMQLFAFNLGQLGGMAKGEIDYDAEAAQAAADNLLAAAKMDQRAMWPQGTDSEAMAGKTEALPVIWTTFPAIEEKADALVAAAETMAGAAGSGVEGIQANIGTVGGSCGGCHKTYRMEK